MDSKIFIQMLFICEQSRIAALIQVVNRYKEELVSVSRKLAPIIVGRYLNIKYGMHYERREALAFQYNMLESFRTILFWEQ